MEWWYRRYNDKGTNMMVKCFKEKGKVLTHLWRSRSTGKTPPRRDLQPEILPQGQSVLKWGLREVQPGSTLSDCTAELPSPVLPGLTGSFPQVLHQWFRPGLNSYHTPPNIPLETSVSHERSPFPPIPATLVAQTRTQTFLSCSCPDDFTLGLVGISEIFAPSHVQCPLLAVLRAKECFRTSRALGV